MNSLPIHIDEAIASAKRLRSTWGLGPRPAVLLEDRASQKGILVLRAELNESISGAFVRYPKDGLSVIVLNVRGTSIHHQRSTLAHEIGHWYLHKGMTGKIEPRDKDENDPQEQAAFMFADELLVPLSEISKWCRQYRLKWASLTNREVIEAADEFGVSAQFILRRLRIPFGAAKEEVEKRRDETDWSQAWRQYAPQSVKNAVWENAEVRWQAKGVTQETAILVSRLPDEYREKAFSCYERGKVTARKLAELLGLSVDVVKSELRPLLRPGEAEEAARMEAEERKHLGME